MKLFKSLVIACIASTVLYLGYSWATPDATDIIVETNKIGDIYKYIEPNEYNFSTLVIFDIDNTIGKFPTDLGSDQWFYAMVDEYKKQGLETQAAIDKVLPTLFNIMFHTWMNPIEEGRDGTVSVITNLQKKNVSVIALTARSLELTQRTIEQMHHMNIYFTKTDPHECPLKYGTGKPGLYLDGIIFSGNYDKGEMIVNWFKATKYKPKKVIFIDDKLKNIKSVEAALHKRDYPFIGIRYGHEDEQVKKFKLSSIQSEMKQFLHAYSMTATSTGPR